MNLDELKSLLVIIELVILMFIHTPILFYVIKTPYKINNIIMIIVWCATGFVWGITFVSILTNLLN